MKWKKNQTRRNDRETWPIYITWHVRWRGNQAVLSSVIVEKKNHEEYDIYKFNANGLTLKSGDPFFSIARITDTWSLLFLLHVCSNVCEFCKKCQKFWGFFLLVVLHYLLVLQAVFCGVMMGGHCYARRADGAPFSVDGDNNLLLLKLLMAFFLWWLLNIFQTHIVLNAIDDLDVLDQIAQT